MVVIPYYISSFILYETGSYEIPKGTMVIANIYGIHRNCTDPEVFKPERWLDENDMFDHQKAPFVLFSMGTRVCVGESLAKVEIMMTLAMFFQKYKFEAPGGVDLSKPPVEIPGIGLEPAPFKLNVINRKK